MGLIKYILDKYFTIVLVEGIQCELRLLYNINSLKCKYHHGFCELLYKNFYDEYINIVMLDYAQSLDILIHGRKEFLESVKEVIRNKEVI